MQRNEITPNPGMPAGTYYQKRNGQLAFWRNLPIRYTWRKLNRMNKRFEAKPVPTIELTPELDAKITHWKVASTTPGTTFCRIYNRKNCKGMETAMKRAKKDWPFDGLVLTGLLVHAETKPFIIE